MVDGRRDCFHQQLGVAVWPEVGEWALTAAELVYCDLVGGFVAVRCEWGESTDY